MEKMTLSSKARAAQSPTEKWMRYLGFPGGIALFLLIFYLPGGAGLSAAAQAGAACFALALVWWVTEPFPTYVTSLVLMFLLLVTRTSNAKAIMDVLGMEVIWLNLLAFILSSMLVKTRLAKRMALWLVVRFGHKATWALLAFLVLQLALAPLIPATAARCVMTLPLMIVVAAIYGSTEATPNAFGKNLMLLNLACISVLSSITMTGSSANLIAVGLIQTMGGHRVYYMDWMRVGAPVAILTMVLMWILGQKLLFRMKPGGTGSPGRGRPGSGAPAVRSHGPPRVPGEEGHRHLRPGAVPLDDRRLPPALVRGGDHRAVRRPARGRHRAIPALGRPAVGRGRHPLAPAHLQRRRLRRRAGPG